MSVILIGMPSCGKSTLGVLLAKSLGYRFIDSDLLIQEREGMLLHDIIAQRGTKEFLKIEDEVNSAIRDERAVISTGGSAVYCERAMKHLSTLGKIVYLRISYETMAERLGDYVHRGVVLNGAEDLREMYKVREALCQRYADITVDIVDGKFSESAQNVILAIKGC